jgi:hypothetical protein
MIKVSSIVVTTLAGLAALLLGACSSMAVATSDGVGTTGTDGNSGSPFVGIALTPSATGFVDNVMSGVIGPWYAYGDSVGPGANVTSTDFSDSDCAKAGFTTNQCSTILAPIPGQPFDPDTVKGMCTNGTAAQATGGDGGSPNYVAIYGAGIALDFHNPGGDAGAARGYFDMTPYVGLGFDFTGDVIPEHGMRVNFPFKDGSSDIPYWGGAGDAATAYSPLTNGAHVEIQWADVGPERFLKLGTLSPPPLDKTQVASIQFQVFTNSAEPTPYSFCVNNLTLLTAL